METIIVDKEDGVVTITLNRPKRLNALSIQLRNELEETLNQLEKDDEAKVVIITGARRADGRPCFSAGADIKEMAEMGETVSASRYASEEEALIKTLQAVGEDRDLEQSA